MTSSAVTPPPVRLADGILVINLDHRPERLERFAEMAGPVPQLEGWQRLAAVNGVELPGYGQAPWFHHRQRDKCWAGRAGCTLSHRKAIEHARDMGWDRVLILEDDVQVGPTFEADAADFIAAMAGGEEWDVCYLGASKPVGPCRKIGDLHGARALYQIFGCNGTFAYLMKRTAFEWVLANLPTTDSVCRGSISTARSTVGMPGTCPAASACRRCPPISSATTPASPTSASGPGPTLA